MLGCEAAKTNGVSIPVYAVLASDLAFSGRSELPAAQAVIWRAIDRLHATGDARRQIGILEHVSRELHALRHEPGEAPQAAHARLKALTHDWLECAPLLG